jgi:hypothetical protein
LTKGSEEDMTDEQVVDPEAGDFKVEDRRHWQRTDEAQEAQEVEEASEAEAATAPPGIIETYRQSDWRATWNGGSICGSATCSTSCW